MSPPLNSRGAARRGAWAWSVAGGAVGGMLEGALVKLLGLDAFNLVFGTSPGDITGGLEGALLGASVGLGSWLAWRYAGSILRGAALAALAGGAAGLIIAGLGGRMLGGSLDLLARSLPGSRLRLDPLGALLGEAGFGTATQMLSATIEGMLFAGFIVAAMEYARRHVKRPGAR